MMQLSADMCFSMLIACHCVDGECEGGGDCSDEKDEDDDDGDDKGVGVDYCGDDHDDGYVLYL